MDNQKIQTFSKRNFYTMKDSGNIFLLAIVVPYVIAFAFILIMSSVAINSGAISSTDEIALIYDEIWFSIPYLIVSELALLGVYFFFNLGAKISFSATKISVKKANVWTILICALAGIFCVLGFMWLIEGCFGSLWEVLGISSGSAVSLPNDNFGWLVLSCILMGILPAIAEELICRGVIFKGLKSRFSSVCAVFLSALIFALMHGSVVQFIYPFLMGVVLAIIMESTNNLLYCMVFHAFNNCTTLTINYLIENNLISLDFSASWMVSWWGVLVAILIALCTIAILFLLWWFYFRKHKKLEEEPVDRSTNTKAFPISLVIGVVISLCLIVINLL